jgi:hypothetical protein
MATSGMTAVVVAGITVVGIAVEIAATVVADA